MWAVCPRIFVSADLPLVFVFFVLQQRDRREKELLKNVVFFLKERGSDRIFYSGC